MEIKKSKSWFDYDKDTNEVVFYSGISGRIYRRPMTDDLADYLNEKLTADLPHIYECDLVALIDYMRNQNIVTIDGHPRYTDKHNRIINIKPNLKEVLKQWENQTNTTSK